MKATEVRARLIEKLLFVAKSIWPEVEAEENDQALHHWYALRYAASWYRSNLSGRMPDSELEEMAKALDFVHRFAHGLTRKGDCWQATPSPQRCDCPMASTLISLSGLLILAELGESVEHVAA